MRSVLRSTSAALLCLVLLVALVPQAAHADVTPPSGVTCSMQSGVLVCTDGSTGPTGSYCITGDAPTVCLSNGGQQTVGRVAMGQGLGSVLGLPVSPSGTGWLSKLTGWFAYAIHTVFVAIAAILKDLVTYLLEAVFAVIEAAINGISAPDWLAQYSMNTVLGNAGPIVGFFLSQFQVASALTLIGAGYGFRLLRKFLTLFQW